MKITDEMIIKMAMAMEDSDWLQPDWDELRDSDESRCPNCGRHYTSDGDGGEDVKTTLRWFLEKALNGENI